ncbi:adenylate/guanylate cyclase domain-containing protein [Sulfitobacter aestuariivivens]|uniref:Adenylate/guanylate cyclase domain-containing protein n=1 Tax=Sulfitobacter aestuariivivens TaxID=2766981 RepID=A0A927D4I7_9RHOB|nr:adenylate/guanylate cyclase domain-containing protein [Sulfitobacter aestuariivivens]MBD3664998.1 adenylate/guanylate cyclase domain-containing protein [Sulfitobacter aestuariivivens]
MSRLGHFFLKRPYWLIIAVFAAIVGLVTAVWFDLKNLSDENLRRQAATLNSVISNVRSYYASNIVGRVISTNGQTQALHNYRDVPGAIPIPATLSLELGAEIGNAEGDIRYRFVSDYPFTDRPPHNMTPFESEALSIFRSGPGAPTQLIQSEGSVWDRQITLATPVIMSGTCVDCHNSHPKSARTDWKVGDVRAIQAVQVHQPVTLNLLSFKWLLIYIAAAGGFGLVFAAVQYRLAGSFSRMNDELAANNAFLADISLKISKYLSPQIYKSIFSGERDGSISTERKKLTVFFSDIKDFTDTTERMQPEELTELLNEYFTEMARIAATHGATIDKFIGDAIVAFFGDPTTNGTREDARACVLMALDMQKRLGDLAEHWRQRGIERPFQARMGINTGYCNVGNFGSDERMDYTIIGAEANLAARLESIAEPGGIVLSFETYAHVRDMVEAEPLEPVRFKGIARQVVPYSVTSHAASEESPVIAAEENEKLTLNLDGLDAAARARVRQAIRDALAAAQPQK